MTGKRKAPMWNGTGERQKGRVPEDDWEAADELFPEPFYGGEHTARHFRRHTLAQRRRISEISRAIPHNQEDSKDNLS